MRKNIFNNGIEILKSNMILAISSAMLLVSCGIQTGGYSDTDGIYYDPNKDTLPEGVMTNNTGNKVGDYYDYQNTYYPTTNQDQIVYEKYKDWNGTTSASNYSSANYGSDWGNYTGSVTNYYSTGWGYPYYGYGFGYPYSGWGMGFGFGWGNWGWYNPYWSMNMGWYGGYNPWYGGYNPWYGGYYPYYGGAYYNPYYGYNGYNGNSYNAPGFKRSGEVGNAFRSVANGGRIQTNLDNSGNRFGTANQPPRMSNQGNNNNGFRSGNNVQPRPNYNNTPRFENSTRPQQQPNYNNGGFRGDNGGGFRSGGNGNFNGGGNNGGGFRSGGGMRSSGGGGNGFRR